MELFFEILIAALAVFGFWCLLRLISDTWLVSPQICMAIDLTEPDEACVSALLDRTERLLSCRRGRPILVVCRREWAERVAEECDIEALLGRHGARLCVLEEQE